MKHLRMRRRATRAASIGLVALGLSGFFSPVHAGLLDSLFGSSEKSAAKRDSKRRDWVLHEFTVIRLAAREAGSPPNQHPQQLNAENLRRLLAQVRIADGAGSEPLFDADELGELVEPLLQAFENAGPNDDVLLLSSARRGGVLLQPYAVTARLFVQSGSLQLIVNDSRYEFMNRYIGTRQQPVFTYGSRANAGHAVLRSDVATAVRPDWLRMSIAATPAANVSPAVPDAGVAVPPVAAPMATPSAAPPPSNDVEQRLTVLKRLRDKGLISEDEYLQKRREILSQL